MLNPPRGVPAFDPIKWEAAGHRAAPAIGYLVVSWSQIDNAVVDAIYKSRIAHRLRNGLKVLSDPVSHKFRERLNEWIRLALPAANMISSADGLRQEAMRLQAIRDDIAHNIEIVWPAEDGDFVIRTTKGASRPIEIEKVGAGFRAVDHEAQKLKPTRYVRIYEEADIWKAIEDMHKLLATMQAVRVAVLNAIPR